jgi:hypothetical protein
VFGGFVGGEHSVEVLQVVVEFVAVKCHVVVAFLRLPYLQVSDKDILCHDEYITRIWGMASLALLRLGCNKLQRRGAMNRAPTGRFLWYLLASG